MESTWNPVIDSFHHLIILCCVIETKSEIYILKLKFYGFGQLYVVPGKRIVCIECIFC